MHLTRETFHVSGVIPIAPANSVEYQQHNLYTAHNQAFSWLHWTGLWARLLGLDCYLD